jgi:hypothetical protein
VQLRRPPQNLRDVRQATAYLIFFIASSHGIAVGSR